MDVGLFLAFFLLLFPLLPLSAQEDSQSHSTCPENFSCGNLGLMNFPYTNRSRPSCGLCMVDCEAKPSPKIALPSYPEHWFDVISIHNSMVKLHDPLLQSPTCESFDYYLGLTDSPSISYTILPNITLFKCKIINSEASKKIADALSGYTKFELCSQFGFTIYYQNPPHNAPLVSLDETVQSYCKLLHLPVVSRDNHPDNIELFELLTAEFDLEWKVSDDCYECHREGHMCKTEWSEKSRCATFCYANSERNSIPFFPFSVPHDSNYQTPKQISCKLALLVSDSSIIVFLGGFPCCAGRVKS